MAKIANVVNFDFFEPSQLQVGKQRLLSKNTHFQSGARAAVKDKRTEFLYYPLPSHIPQRIRAILLKQRELIQFRKVFDCFWLGSVWHSQNQ